MDIYYYRNECEDDISDAEYHYSKKQFGRPLCFECQEEERDGRHRSSKFSHSNSEMKPQPGKTGGVDHPAPKSYL
jgi:hypothetical protein